MTEPEGLMGEFMHSIRERVRDTKQALLEARETGDEYSAGIRETELDDLRRLAAAHGVNVD